MFYNKENRGMALITILLMMVILVMLTVALITVNSNNLLYTLNYNSRVAALMAAESGVACAIYELQGNDDWAPSEFKGTAGNGKFTIYFAGADHYSTNNLDGEGIVSGFRNTNVLPYSVDLIVKGESGSTVRYIRVSLGRANISEGGRCSGTADVYAGKFIIKRATTAKDQNEGGSFHSNYKNPVDPNDYSITTTETISGEKTEVYAHGGVISACGGIELEADRYDANSGTQLRSKVEPKPIPDVDIKALVNSKSTVNNTQGKTYRLTQDTAGGPFKLVDVNGNDATIPGTYIDQDKGQLVFTQDVYFNNDVKFEFPMVDNHYGTAGVRLEKTGGHYPSVYVNGSSKDTNSFWVMGKLEGNGSIYNTGSTKFIMQTDLVADEETGTELLSEGDITINLPASRLSPISLNLTGAVLTHGNLNAGILDPNHPDNPSQAMTGNCWPGNWVEQAYNNVAPPAPSATPSTVNIPSSGLSMTGSNGKVIEFIPDGRASILAGQTNAQIVPSTATLTMNGDGTYTFGGTANFVHIYYDGYKCDQDTANSWVTNGSTIGNGSGDLHLDYWHCASPIGHYVTRNYFGSNAGAFQSFVHNTLVDYEKSLGGNPTVTPPAEEISGELYAPDVLVTGALVVTDPNNLDGTGNHTINAGNIGVNLIGPKDKGDFTIVHSRNYEKLLASPEIKTKVVVNTWEELR